jgi:glycolate oxidase FAD binding subunit
VSAAARIRSWPPASWNSSDMANLVPPQLAKASSDARPAGPGDVVCGQLARFAAAPASIQEAAALLRGAAALDLAVLPRGTASRIDWGPPPGSCDLIVDTRNLGEVIEHAAGDLVVRVQAGVRLEELQDKLAAEGQRLALDPPGGGTVGGLIATGVAGPLRLRYGTPRDLLIGITVVRADGVIAKAGGKVVKNVAGYDLGKLFAGSYGTLGLITEATFRLHPLPAASATVALDCPDPAAAAAAIQAAAASPLAPSAIELDWPSAAEPITVAVLLEGDEASVAERAERMVGLQGTRATAEVAAGPLILGRPTLDRNARPGAGTYIRVGFWAGQLVSVLHAISAAAAEHALEPVIGGSAAAGVLHVSLAPESPATAVAGFVSLLRAGLAGLASQQAALPPAVASAVVLDAPAAVRDAVDMWGPVPSLAVMRAIKDQFDPEHRMAPGRLAGAI